LGSAWPFVAPKSALRGGEFHRPGPSLKKRKSKPGTPNGKMDALVIAIARSGSMAVRHKASQLCRTLRAAAHDGIATGCHVSCMRAGRASVSGVIRAFVTSPRDGTDLAGECLEDAVGAVVVHRVCPTALVGWGEYARLSHLVTLIVAGAVNVDEWRATLVARGTEHRRHAVYCDVMRHVDAWVSILPLPVREKNPRGADKTGG
jgi:hypothetical protein